MSGKHAQQTISLWRLGTRYRAGWGKDLLGTRETGERSPAKAGEMGFIGLTV